VTKSGKILFISGQTALDRQGKIVGENSIEAQTQQVLENLEAVLKRAGGGRKNLVATTSYVTDMKNLGGFYLTRREFFAGALPTSTTIIVKGLARDEFLVEIEAIAIL
jgi:enamine deaminase RidA (YjgF/YER057c/UK114 family)